MFYCRASARAGMTHVEQALTARCDVENLDEIIDKLGK